VVESSMKTGRAPNQAASAKPVRALAALALLALLGVLSRAIARVAPSAATSSPAGAACVVSHGAYGGAVYEKPHATLENACLVESEWLRLARHAVRKDGRVIDDWLWLDYHDRVNVLAEAPRAATATATADGAGPPAFLVLAQTKYALEGPSLAVVGGIVEPGEDAGAAARREAAEELRVACRRWEALGRFRTDVNRGMGWVHPYLARDCSYSSDRRPNDGNEADDTDDGVRSDGKEKSAEVGGHDTEQQHVQVMTLPEVKRAVVDGKFVEVQWSNTVALAMLHLS